MEYTHPLMHNNITRDDLDKVIDYLSNDDPRLTQGPMVDQFEKEWSDWLGVRNSLFVNSGASANLLTIQALKTLYPNGGEIIVPTLTWISDVASVIQSGFTPVFVDCDLHHLGMDNLSVIKSITDKTIAVFITHVQGFNSLSDELINELEERDILLIEDVCEAHGAKHDSKLLGSIGWISNFSFFYAHHMSTIEGGMICTNDDSIYQTLRMLRSHGMVRESTSDGLKNSYYEDYPELNPDFIFSYPSFNFRNNEIGAIIGLNQLKRLNQNIEKRNANQELLFSHINSDLYHTDFKYEGCSNYAFNIIMKHDDNVRFTKLISLLNEGGIEFRRGSAGGGNQLRQPYLRDYASKMDLSLYPNTDHVHNYGMYIGNYPELDESKISRLAQILNSVE